jgi:hypothetical protein
MFPRPGLVHDSGCWAYNNGDGNTPKNKLHERKIPSKFHGSIIENRLSESDTILNDEPDIIKLVKSGTLGNLSRINKTHCCKKLTFSKPEDTERMWKPNTHRRTRSRNTWNAWMKGKEPKQKHC